MSRILLMLLAGILFPAALAAQDMSAKCTVTATSAGEARPASVELFCPAGWIRTERRAGKDNFGHVQVNYSMPGAPQYSLNIQFFPYGQVVALWSGTSAIHLSAEGFIREITRDVYDCRSSGTAQAGTSVTPSQDRVLGNGRWKTFSVDIARAQCLGSVPMLGNLYPIEAITEPNPRPGETSGERWLISANMQEFSNTRHEYAILPAGSGIYVLVYAAPVAHFNEKFFASVIETADFGTAKVEVRANPGIEVLVDGGLKGKLPAGPAWNPKAQTSLVMELPVGLHSAKFRAAGFDDLEMDLEVLAGGDGQVLRPEMQPAGTAPKLTASQLFAFRTARLEERPFDRALRADIIRSALAMKVLPSSSDAAVANEDSAEYVLRIAKSETDFLAAAKYFEKASLAAPWRPANYAGAASAYRQAGLPAKAARQLEFYLIASPKAKDASEVRRRIAALDATARQPGIQGGASARDELKQYVAYYQKAPNDAALLQKIIRLALTIDPKPAVPDEADELAGRAISALKNATTTAGYADAANAYLKALLLAPWVAEYYFNAGVAMEKSGKHKEAAALFDWYLHAAPEAEDAKAVRTRIGGLKYSAEKNGAMQGLREIGEGKQYFASYCSSNSFPLTGCTLAVYAGKNWYTEDEPGTTSPKLYQWQFRTDGAYLVMNGTQEVLRVRSQGPNVFTDLVWETRSEEAGGLGAWIPAPFVDIRPFNAGGRAQMTFIVGRGMSSQGEPKNFPAKSFRYTMYQAK